MTLLAKKKYILVGLEDPYGVDPTPTQAIETSELNINPLAGPRVSRNLDRATLGNNLQVLVGSYVELTFKVELAGSGAAGTRPAYADLLLACAAAETVAAATSVTYKPVSGDYDSVTIYFKHDGQEHILTGCYGSVDIEADAGSIPHLAFSFMGLYNAPASVSDGTPDFSDFLPALPVNNTNTTTFTLHSIAAVMERFNFKLGCQLEYRNVVGAESINLYDRLPSASTTIETPPISTKNWFEAARLNQSGAFSMVHGVTAGNIVTLSGPVVVPTEPRYSGDKASLLQLGLTFLPNTGDDDWSLVFT